MAAWKGWAGEFLTDAGITRTAGALRFLADWNANTDTDCANNPLDLSHPIPGSKDCAPLKTGPGPAQKYGSHSVASHAFDVQIHAKYARPILAALVHGDPYKAGDNVAVAQALELWGSAKFEQFYFDATNPDSGTVKGPHALDGWKALRKSVNRDLPVTLTYSGRVNRATLRTLARARKVRV